MSGVYRINGYNSVRRINTKRVSAGAVGWWLAGGISAANCIAAYQPKGAASYAASLVDLSGSGNNATEGNAPTWNTGVGWTFNGTADYLDTGIKATEPMSVIIRFDNATTPANGYPTIFGSIENGKSFYIHIRTTLNNRYYIHGGFSTPQQVIIDSNLSNGVIAIAETKPYENGLPLASNTSGWSGTPTYTMVIGARREANGTVNYYFAGNMVAIAFYSVTITAEQVAALTTAMNAL